MWRSWANCVEHIHVQIANAVRSVQSQVRWKPGSAVRHLLKRKLRGHLPSGATLDDYERLVWTVLQDLQAQVYLYRYHDILYVAVVAVVEQRHWLVMFAMDGVMESAYVVERPEQYLSHPAFAYIGSLSEVMA
jgi:hypothetical protein